MTDEIFKDLSKFDHKPRYIDANSLKVVMVFSPKLEHLKVPEMRDILIEIDSVPTADVRPVGHGLWVNDSDGAPCCSECGECAMQRLHLHSNNKSFDAPFVLTDFCPSCGVYMLSEPYKQTIDISK